MITSIVSTTIHASQYTSYPTSIGTYTQKHSDWPITHPSLYSEDSLSLLWGSVYNKHVQQALCLARLIRRWQATWLQCGPLWGFDENWEFGLLVRVFTHTQHFWSGISLQHYTSRFLDTIHCRQTLGDVPNNGDFSSVWKIRVYQIVFRLRQFEIHISSFFHWS